MSAYSINNLCDVIFKLFDQYKCKQILVLLANDGGACVENKLHVRHYSNAVTLRICVEISVLLCCMSLKKIFKNKSKAYPDILNMFINMNYSI
jgi:hypothetical protein